MVVELTNDLIMYQPTRAAFEQQGYETLVGANRVALEGVETIVDSAVDWLEQLWRQVTNEASSCCEMASYATSFGQLDLLILSRRGIRNRLNRCDRIGETRMTHQWKVGFVGLRRGSGLVRSLASHPHLRFDLGGLIGESGQSAARHQIVQALKAEGLETAVWQTFILPKMTVFQAKNAYGYGAPWSSPHAQPVDYSLDQYPVAQRHCDTHTCLVYPLRYPNPPATVELIVAAIWKVMEQVDSVVN